MNRSFYASRIYLLGLFLAQTLATVHVYLSNAKLYNALIVIQERGYLAIPNENIMRGLKSFGPAFFGGFFFTLSLGAGLTIFSFALAWMLDRLFFRNRLILVVPALLLAACVVAINWRGLDLIATFYFLIIPPVVFGATLKWMPQESGEKVWLRTAIHFTPVIVLALIWFSVPGRNVFLGFRDNVLLSNPIGKRANDFYYTYTLYPAEAIKSLDQKILKTCNLARIEQKSTGDSLERELRNHNYLHVGDYEPVDLKISQDGALLLFENEGKTILRTSADYFLSRPEDVLGEFSHKSDKHYFFRRFIFLSLSVAFPFLLYIFPYGLFRFGANRFFGSMSASLTASILALLLGLVLIMPLHIHEEEDVDTKDLVEALESERWQRRVAAIKAIEKNRLEIGDYERYRSMLSSPNMLERYWLARVMGVSQRNETFEDLLAFLDDPNPNVVTMALYALGQREDTRAVKEILQIIETSDNWYVQLYAYNALMRLGWRQAASKQEPFS